jgi:hypothetical protein
VTEALFAHGLVKPLTAEVYLDAVRVALGPQVEAGQEDPWRKLAGSWRKLFPEVVATGDQATIDQALGLANGPEFHVALQRAAERWVQEQSERTQGTVKQLMATGLPFCVTAKQSCGNAGTGTPTEIITARGSRAPRLARAQNSSAEACRSDQVGTN